ncbi:hypothetical protein [Spirosoma pollinicola]|uniref:Uncharacterized protein n=1 Tax=Spirosoma pollinicola TaxID=2057025 RepID=A0A2K8Z9X4_9BACT|nr:hypothetical protein [Spirosoma pollinicola]AUD06645.1 hypothetical protein CWM47_35245 [Spirosoma pollinicola]
MDTPLSDTYIDYDDELDPSRVLTSWCEAITGLFMYYNALHSHMTTHSTSDAYIGQCPFYQLVQLAKTMHEELAKLEQDLGQFPGDNQSTSQQAFKRLAAHTNILNQLNQQARIKLRLAEMPAC